MTTVLKKDVVEEAISILSEEAMTEVKAFAGDMYECSRNINNFFEDKDKEVLSIHSQSAGNSSNVLVIVTFRRVK